MDWVDIEYRFKKYCVTYFDLTTRANRKEFNFGILIYSVVFLGILYLLLDLHAINDFMQTQVSTLQYEAYQGNISEEDAALQTMKGFADLIPITFMNCFALLLLPLYIRRLNDTIFHTIGFAFPIVVVFVFDALQSIFNFGFKLPLYDAMGFYNFIIIALLCIYPSKKQEES